MSMLRQKAAVLAMFSIVFSSAACARSASVSPTDDEVVVGLAEGVMAALGAPANRLSAPGSTFRVDPQSGQEIYSPTGESVDEVIPVRARRDDRFLSVQRAASASSEPAGARVSDGGVDAPTRRDAGRSAT